MADSTLTYFCKQRTMVSILNLRARTMFNNDFLILRLLMENSAGLFGSDMIELSKGQLKRGSAYTTLQRMEDRGLIKSELKDGAAGDLPRRLHRITGLGQTSYQNALASHGLVQATAMGMNGAFTV